MITGSFDYLAPATLDETVTLLAQHGADAKLLAGGHSLIPAMKLRQTTPSLLIDVQNIHALRGIQVNTDALTIGAMTTHADIEYDDRLRARIPLLPQAAQIISDPLIRNRGTFGGALAQAEPEGDWPAVALALDTNIVATSATGRRTIPVTNFFLDTHTTALTPDEVLCAVEITIPPAHAHMMYRKRTHPANGYALVGVAVVATFTDDGTCDTCRIGITGAGRHPVRAVASEHLLVGQHWTAELIAAAAAACAGESLEFAGDRFASAVFRAHLLVVDVKRTLHELMEAAHANLRHMQ